MGIITKKKNQQRGYALALVLIFMTAILLLGTALLISAESSAKQSKAVNMSEKNYYSAESGAQLATQMLQQELAKLNQFKGGAISSPSYLNMFAANFESEIRLELQEKYLDVAKVINGDVANEIDGMVLNGEVIKLGDELIVKNLDIGREVKTLVNVKDEDLLKEEDVITYYGIAYLKGYELNIAATSGVRTVLAVLKADDCGVDVTLKREIIKIGRDPLSDADDWISEFDSYNGTTLDMPLDDNGDYDPDALNEYGLNYGMFNTALSNLLTKASDLATAAVGNLDTGITGEVIGDPRTGYSDGDDREEANTFTLTGKYDVSSNYYVAEGDLHIKDLTNKEDVNGNDPDNKLKYLYVKGNLTMSGTIDLQYLEGVYIEGNASGTALDIKSGANISCNPTRRNHPNGPIIGTTFIVGKPGSGAEMLVGIKNNTSQFAINHCVFYVPSKITIYPKSDNNSYFSGNSVYIAYNREDSELGVTDGEIYINSDILSNTSIGGSDKAPQFYSVGKLEVTYKGNASIHGIYNTLDTLINNGGSNQNHLLGFAMGKELTNFTESMGTPAQKLGYTAIYNLIDMGLIFSEVNTQTEKRRITIDEVLYNYNPTGMDIRETTGENPSVDETP